jgi:uncharacterized protein (DUF1015 family)
VPRVSPFHALLYDDAVAGPPDQVTAPPYDVISDGDRAAYLALSPYNVVHLDLPQGPRDGAGDCYTRAAELMARWRGAGVLRESDEPLHLVVELAWAGEDQPAPAGRIRGLLTAMDLEPFGHGVLPHEQVMKGPLEDRTRLLRATETSLSPVYGTVEGPHPGLTSMMEEAAASPPWSRVIDQEGVTHSMWPLPDPDGRVAEILAADPFLIADGHHRYTTALSYRDEMRALHGGPGPWDRLLVFLVDAGSQDVPVLPYHRIQLEGDAPVLGEPVAGLREALAAADDDDLTVGIALAGPDGVEYRAAKLDGEPPTVRALHARILDRTAPGDALRFTNDPEAADRAVRDDGAVAAWFLPPTEPDRILKVVRAGERLPRKSTSYWPKPRTGLAFLPVGLPVG